MRNDRLLIKGLKVWVRFLVKSEKSKELISNVNTPASELRVSTLFPSLQQSSEQTFLSSEQLSNVQNRCPSGDTEKRSPGRSRSPQNAHTKQSTWKMFSLTFITKEFFSKTSLHPLHLDLNSLRGDILFQKPWNNICALPGYFYVITYVGFFHTHVAPIDQIRFVCVFWMCQLLK